MLSFVFIKPIAAHAQFEDALIGEDPEELLRYSAPLERAFNEIKEWTSNEGAGRVLTAFGNQIGIQIPAEKILKLSEFTHKYEFSAKTALAVGIGTTPHEAFKAMQQSEIEGGNRIVLYSKELETEGYGDLVEDENDLSKNGYSIEFPNLHKEDAEFKQAIDASAAQPPPQPEQVQEVNASTPAPQAQPQQMGGQAQDYAGPTDKAKQNIKQKVLEALGLVKHYSVDILRLKEINPKAFNAIKKLIDAMVKMAETHGDMAKTESVGIFLDVLSNLKKGELEKCDFNKIDQYFTAAEEDPSMAPPTNTKVLNKMQGVKAPVTHRTGNTVKTTPQTWTTASRGLSNAPAPHGSEAGFAPHIEHQ